MGLEAEKKINMTIVNSRILDMLPAEARRIFSVLEKEENTVIKGGVAKLVAMKLLESKGIFRDRQRMANESRINDIDLDFIVVGNAEAARDLIIEKFNRLADKFATAGIFLDAKDVEIIKAANFGQGIEKIINRNDLAMNEFAMDFSGRTWRLHYTQRACQQLIDGIGVLNSKPGHIHYDAGRVFPSALGMVRLIKFLVAGKVNKIYLPNWWRKLYFENYQKKVAAGEMPANAPLGYYSLVLLKNYFGNNDLLQKKAMVAFYDLGFTDMLDPELYIRQQEQVFKNSGSRFEQNDFTIEDVISRYLENEQKKIENQKNRQAARAQCVHEFQTIDCDLCGKNQCAIEACAKCGKNKNSNILPCTLRMYSGQTDQAGFYEMK